MAEFTVNATRFDPYKNFKFRVKWDGTLRRRRQQGQRAQADDRGRQAPRRRRPEQQPQVARAARSTRRSRSSAASPTTSTFEQWANKVWNYGSGLGAETSLKDFRKDIIIEVYNEAGQLAIAYKVYRCWVSEYQALPELDANANAVAIQTHQARERGLGARLRRGRADGAVLHRAVTTTPTLADAAVLLAAWEAASAVPACAVGATLLHRSGLVDDLADALDLPLATSTAAVARLYVESFGDVVDAVVGCPACGETLEVALPLAASDRAAGGARDERRRGAR